MQAMYRYVTANRGFVVYLTLVMAALCALRILFGHAPENIDVREQFAFLEAWRLGYGSGANPPLFTWAAKLVHAVVGQPLAALEMTRFAMLWLACFFIWRAMRCLLVDRRLAAIVGLAPFASIMLGWEVLFRYSNTTALIMSVFFTFYALVRLDRNPALASYLLLGIAVGVGLLSKLNYAVFLVALVAGAMTDPGLRARLRDRRSFATLGVALAVASPLAIWFARQSGRVLGHGHQRMTLPPSYDYLGVPVPVSLLLDIVVGIAGIGVPLLVFVALLAPLAFRPGWTVATGAVARYQRCLAVHLAAMTAIVVLGLLIFEVTFLSVHYFLVYGLLIPLVMLRVEAANPSEKRRRALGMIVAAMPAVVVLGTLLRGLTYGR